MKLAAQLEALLFYRGEEVPREDAAQALGVDSAALERAVEELGTTLSARGLRLLVTEGALMLATAPEASGLIERLRKEELSRELSKAAGETLAIVLYQGPLGRADIDFIRGVNSSAILRTLQIRGLVERTEGGEGERGFRYRATPELLAHVGITRIEELPEFDKVKRELETFRRGDDTTTPNEHESEHGGDDETS